MKQGDELLEEWDWNEARPTGMTVARGDAHLRGIPHEGVHLWVMKKTGQETLVLFQKRASIKESYPDCLDITVGGHVPFGRSSDKIQKESMEEIGIAPPDEDLVDLGYYRYEEWDRGMVHREFQRVYLYIDNRELDEYRFIDGEVEGIYAVRLDDFENMFAGHGKFSADGYDGKCRLTRQLTNLDFHPLLFSRSMEAYMHVLIAAMKQIAGGERVTVSMPRLQSTGNA